MFFRRKIGLRTPKEVYRKRLFLVLCAAFVFFVILFLIIELRIKPIIHERAKSEVRKLCVSAIDEATDKALMTSSLGYDDLIKVQRDGNNEITALNADVARFNEIKVSASKSIEDSLAEIDGSEISFPLGTLLGGSVFSGKGPDVDVALTVSGSSEIELKSEFCQSGINQTIHRIFMNVKCELYIVIAGRQTQETVELNVPIAETVIVGDVPSTFLDVDKTGKSVLES